MKPSTAAILGAAAVCAALAACSNKVSIKAEQSAAATGSTGSSTTMMTAGSGASGPGGTTGSGGAGTGGGSTTSTGTGAGPGKVVTADNDIGQYQSFTFDGASAQPALQGPFFVTDVWAPAGLTFSTVSGSDCSAPQTIVGALTSSVSGYQLHGIRLPIFAGQSLCHSTYSGGAVTILGFRPY